MKKALSVLLSIIMLLSITAGINLSAYAETSEDYEYSVLDDGTVAITKYNGSDSNVTIPSTIDGKTVTSIGEYAFYDCTDLTSINIPDGVTSIDSSAFCNCINLESINIPNSVMRIGDYAFFDCYNLTSVTIPYGVKSIEAETFHDCESLTNISIPNSVTYIGMQAFYGCRSLARVVIPDSVTSLGEDVFSNCFGLRSIAFLNKDLELFYGSIPKEITIMGYSDSAVQGYADAYNCEFIAIDQYDCTNGIHCYDSGMNCLLCGYLNAVPFDWKGDDHFAEIKTEGDNCFFSIIPEKDTWYMFLILGVNIGIEEVDNEFVENAEYLDVVACIYDEDMNEVASSTPLIDIVHSEDTESENAQFAKGKGIFCVAKLSKNKTYYLKCHFASPNETGTVDVLYGDHDRDSHFYNVEKLTPYDACKAHVEYTCLACGNTTTEDIAHYATSFYEEEIEATCTTEGRYEGQYCSVCKEVIWGLDTIPAKGHSYDAGKVTKVATCTENGIKTYTCTVCGEIKEETIPATGHTVVTDKAVSATCTTAGKTEGSHCSTCNAVITAQETVAATGHSYDSGKVTKSATCSEAGVKTFTCTKCNATKTEAISAKGHTVVTDKAIAATCTTAGKTEGTHCSVCNAVITAQKAIAATGHSYDTGKVTKTATCTVAGVKTFTCTKCKATKTETISAKGHTVVTDKAVSATCTKTGKTAGSHCSVCNTVITAQKTVSATGHSYDAGKVTKAATCTASGVKTFTCTKCKTTKTETIKAKGHTVVTDKAVSATCTKAGKTAGSHCSVCNTVIKKQETVKATGHSYDAGKVTKAPTVTATGVKTYTCTKCKVTKTETIKATGLKAPTLKVTVNSNGTFKMTWNKVTGAEKYDIYYKQADGSYKLLKTVTGTSYTSGFAQYGKQYSYKMQAVTGSVKSSFSSVVNATNNKKLQTPTLKVAVNSNGTFKMTWNKVTGATSYQIYYKQADGSYKLLKTVTGTSYTSGFAQYGKQYSYKMRAVTSKNSSATSNYSSVVNAKNTKKLGTPTMKATVNKNGSFKLSWGKVTGATSYQIYWKQANGSYKLLKTVSGTSYTTVVAAKGKTYTYKVRAVTNKNSSAASNYSNVVNAKRK